MEPAHNGNMSFVGNVDSPKHPNSKYGTFCTGGGDFDPLRFRSRHVSLYAVKIETA